MPGRGTQQRTVRVPEELWEAALVVAKRRGESVSDVLRAALESYVADDKANASAEKDTDAQ